MAVHIGADVVPGRRPVRSSRDTLRRMSRLCAAAGLTAQVRLTGERATCDGVRRAVGRVARLLAPGGLLVLTFSGHSERGPSRAGWCLHDGVLRLPEVASLLATVPRDTCVVVVADTCYAAALAQAVDPGPVPGLGPALGPGPVPGPALVLLAACGAGQCTLDRPSSEFVERLERLVLPGGVRDPACASYAWLATELCRDTPDVERPSVWTNRADAWTHRPFDPAGQDS